MFFLFELGGVDLTLGVTRVAKLGEVGKLKNSNN